MFLLIIWAKSNTLFTYIMLAWASPFFHIFHWYADNFSYHGIKLYLLFQPRWEYRYWPIRSPGSYWLVSGNSASPVQYRPGGLTLIICVNMSENKNAEKGALFRVRCRSAEIYPISSLKKGVIPISAMPATPGLYPSKPIHTLYIWECPPGP